MPNYKIKKYIETDKSSDLVTWYNSLEEKGKAVFSVRMDYLSACNTSAEWTMPYCKPLGAGIIEIRFKDRKVQQRPLGYFGPNTKEFTFLFPATEKGSKFIPKDAIARAKNRKKTVTLDPRRSHVWDFRLNEEV